MGFKISYHGQRVNVMSTNLQSARINPTVITESLSVECKEGFRTGPYKEPPHVNLKVSGLDVFPKKDGSWKIKSSTCHPQEFQCK